jgi:hypothetical protein
VDIWFDVLLIAHLAAFAVGITTTITAPLVVARMAAAPPEAKPVLGSLMLRLGKNARLAFIALVLTGVALVYQRYGGFDGQNFWFWVKMALVAFIGVSIILSMVLKPGTLSPRIMGWATRLSMAGIVISAVLAFN